MGLRELHRRRFLGVIDGGGGTNPQHDPNVFIGGVAYTINTPELLAAKLQNYPDGTAFSASNMQNFSIVGNDIQCYIGVDYQIAPSAFQSNGLITYYKDNAKCKKIGVQSFSTNSQPSNLKSVEFKECLIIDTDAITGFEIGSVLEFALFPKCTTVSGSGNFRYNTKLHALYIPLATTLGNTAALQFVLQNLPNAYLYLHPSLQTANNGAEEADIVNARTFGSKIRYVSDFTTPGSITNLSTGNILSSAIQLNFTPPASVNPIDYYEVWVNGKFNNVINKSGGYATGLSPSVSYIIEAKPVDIYYNKASSNTVTQLTEATEPRYIKHIVSYTKMENDVLDSWATNNGVPTAINYASGLVGQSAVFTAVNSQIKINSSKYKFFGTANFSFVCIVNLSSLPTGSNVFALMAIQENATAGTVDKAIRINANGQVIFYVFDGSARNAISPVSEIATNTNYVIIGTYDGVNLRIYKNAVLKGTQAASGSYNFANPALAISHISGTSISTKGQIDECIVLNTVLTQAEVTETTNKLLSGQSLI